VLQFFANTYHVAGIYAYVSLKEAEQPSDALKKELIQTVRKEIGGQPYPLHVDVSLCGCLRGTDREGKIRRGRTSKSGSMCLCGCCMNSGAARLKFPHPNKKACRDLPERQCESFLPVITNGDASFPACSIRGTGCHPLGSG
jgi:hypothetical protein